VHKYGTLATEIVFVIQFWTIFFLAKTSDFGYSQKCNCNRHLWEWYSESQHYMVEWG